MRIWQHEVKEYGLWEYSAPLTRSDTPVAAPEGASITVERKRTASGKALADEGSDSLAAGGESAAAEESMAPGATAVAEDAAAPPVTREHRIKNKCVIITPWAVLARWS